MHLFEWLFAAYNGIATGMAIFLVAAGLTWIFGILKILNMAHGHFFMIGVYVAFSIVGRHPPADPDPRRHLVEQQVGDQQDAGEPFTQRIATRCCRMQFEAQHWSPIFCNAEFYEEESVVPFEQLPICLP